MFVFSVCVIFLCVIAMIRDLYKGGDSLLDTSDNIASKSESKKCVICHSNITPATESSNYIGAHEWCETYY